MSDSSPAASGGFKTTLVAIVVIGGILLLGTLLFVQRELAFQDAAKQWAQTKFGLSSEPVTNRLAADFVDEDQDLVADLPTDPSQHVTPEVIRFCYIPSGGDESGADAWAPFVKHLEAAIGRPVEYLQVRSIDSQLAALKSGYLHVTGLNTGSVPRAVNVCGFVPVCTIADGEGEFGYQMQIIVPADSQAKKVASRNPTMLPKP
ncbi:MAG: PhnD/SsuA/transferrin family substrate-binding protein [Planctomycetota bacterium]